MTKFSALIIALATAVQVQAAVPSDTCNQETWITNGPVYAIVPSGDKVYIGGKFTQVGPYTGGGVPIDSSTGAAVSVFPKINGGIFIVCADGNGGWFVGGKFTSVGGAVRNNIAHILFNGNVDPNWYPNANNQVNSLVMSGTTVYAGGDFTNIGQGITHSYFAQFGDFTPSPVIRSASQSSGVSKIGFTITNMSCSNMRSGAAVKFAYSLSKAERVSLRLYSINGQMQSELVNKNQNAGNYSLSMKRGVLAAGSYLVAFSAGEYHQEKMIFLMK